MDAAIATENLRRTYRRSRKETSDRVALDDVTLTVQPGELFGLLGPNGAGKTTLIKILTTLLLPTSGRAWVDGLDVAGRAELIRPRINMVSGGESAGYGLLTVRENLWLFSQLYGVPSRLARERIDRMLAVVGLEDRASTKISQLSTGLRQKMNFCRGFITDPKILFLDEPTLGLDVQAARAIRGFVRQWLAEQPGRTLLLTTHYMQEADELCDRVAIIDQGRLLACDTPTGLKRQVRREAIFEIDLAPGQQMWTDLKDLPGVIRAVVTDDANRCVLRLSLDEDPVIGRVVQAIVERGGHILSLRNEEATLEDVFIHLVGRKLEAAPNGAPIEAEVEA
jgi:ABC-2 type transport system ATP-binding protein